MAANGTLVYQTGAYIEHSDLAWFDRTGKPLGTLADRQPYGHVALDRRGSVVVVALRGLQPNLWTTGLVRGVKTRLTFNLRDQAPQWSPDGRQVAFASIKQSPQTELELTVMDFATRRERQFRTALRGDKTPASWSPDGRLLFYTTASRGSRTGSDLHYITLADGESHATDRRRSGRRATSRRGPRRRSRRDTRVRQDGFAGAAAEVTSSSRQPRSAEVRRV